MCRTRFLCRHLHFVFFFNDTATTEIYTLSLHDALPIFDTSRHIDQHNPISVFRPSVVRSVARHTTAHERTRPATERSEEHTSELQSRQYLVCRLLLEKKKHKITYILVFIFH